MATLEERLRLVVDATTGSAEASFGKLTGAATDTARASDAAAASVAGAADAVAQARAKEADAAGKLSVAEVRLQELRDKGNASASAIAGAEERVASAQRNVQLAAANTSAALEQQNAVQEESGAAAEEASSGAEGLKDQLNEVRDTVVGIVAGASLADWLSESVTGFLEGARGASGLAQSMNATIEQAGALNTLMGNLGLEMDDLLEIQAEFASQVAANGDLLGSFGAHVIENSNGTTNWALTLEDALEQLQKIPDATKRNQIGFQIFGEEGYKQLSRLLLSGTSVHDALEKIGTPFDADDVATTARFDAAMTNLSLTSGGLGRDVGSLVVPVIAGLAEIFGDVVDVVTSLPGPIGIAVIAALGLAAANAITSESGGILAVTMSAISGASARFTAAVSTATASTGVFGAVAGVATVAGRGLLTVLGGPVGIALIALGGAFALLNSGIGENKEKAEDDAAAQSSLADALKESNGVVTDAVRRQAALSAQQVGLLGTAKDAGIAAGTLTDGLLGNADAYDATVASLTAYADQLETNLALDRQQDTSTDAQRRTMQQHLDAVRGQIDSYKGLHDSESDQVAQEQELGDALGETTDLAAVATAAMDALSGMIDDGTTSGEAFTGAVKTAADAQEAQSRSSDLAKAAIDAYHASTDGAVQATLDFIDARYQSEDANFAFLSAMDDAASATDDASTSVDEYRQAQVKVIEAALSAASASADAAVANATATGQVVDDVSEAQIRATSMLADLREKINEPGLTDDARGEIQGLIDKLADAQSHGDIAAVLTLTGAPEAQQQIAQTTEGGTATVAVATTGGPAVIDYLAQITNAPRLAIIKVESRNGPAVDTYLDSLAVGHDRLALVRVESRGGPDVDAYLDGLAQDRLAIIRVETRNGPAVDTYLNNLARDRTALINASHGSGAGFGGRPPVQAMRGAPGLGDGGRFMVGSVTLDLELTGSVNRTALSSAERGRATITDIRAYERSNGTGWRGTR